ncbi:M20 metallopeptidase family protein [Streptomyces drozdowiczii]|uniref:M20 family metallopeptidase n=1 Tax=Streptomyces drozdowiczii TaxID=202862 RepID=A0ABY6PZ67_9ACTN|nr:M20 family metallopeptidase [Streptomyces drozdowiczii]MCX0242277.1 M20 family metallopeptidase [Streptomyces drozdowiczii]UZK57652.1 M20 family metallopeptidase [Streptomyces drozdowiczii]
MFARTDALAFEDSLVRLRHALHRQPELGLDLPRTQQAVLDALSGLPLEITTGDKLTSVTAVLRGGRPGPAVLLRGDMDALPVQEDSGVPYVSEVPGRMHACGHDVHTAGLVGAAMLLAARREELAGDVVFMFQPGEEGMGGARLMIEEGVLDAAGSRVVAAYALHVTSAVLPVGTAAVRPGPMLAASDEVTVRVEGAGGHGSSPHLAKDPVPAVCEMVTALQTLVTRTVDIFDPAVITVGSLHAGSAGNVIPGTAEFTATIRTFSEETRARVRAALERTVRGIAAAHGLTAGTDYREGYPVTVNDAAEAAFALRTAREVFGAGQVFEAPRPMAGSEDFSYVLNEVPGAYVGLGACPSGQDPSAAPMNHSAQAVYDDRSVADAAALLAGLAARRLQDAGQPS